MEHSKIKTSPVYITYCRINIFTIIKNNSKNEAFEYATKRMLQNNNQQISFEHKNVYTIRHSTVCVDMDKPANSINLDVKEVKVHVITCIV